MLQPMRRCLTGIALVVLFAGPAAALAESYPARPVRLITPQSAGASMDILVRIVAPKMSELLGQSFVVDNRGGAGGIIGVETGARSAPDGYTLVMGAPATMIIARFVQRNLPYDPLRDFEPISLIVNAEAVMVIYPGLPAKNVQEFIALAKAQPGKLNMASAGIGSSSHLAGVLFTTLAGINSVHVPYKGGGPVASALIAGESHWTIVPAAAVAGQIKAGRLRALAVSTKKRSPLMPDLPTLDEAGVPGYEYNAWNGVFAPKGTSRAVIRIVHATIQKALADPDVTRQYANQGLPPAGSASPEHFAAFLRADYDRIARLVKIAGIKPE
jgi:tripartite-type tricarboxylate transporter receptor subunit TctC